MSKALKEVKAWCSGKAYNRPSKAHIDCYEKYIAIWDGSVCLNTWRFRRKSEFWSAVKIVIVAMKKYKLKNIEERG